MTSIYLYTDVKSLSILLNSQQKLLLIGGDFGYGNFGDLLQQVNAIQIARQSKRFAIVSVLATNAINSLNFPDWARENYDIDAIIFVSDYPLILSEDSPALIPLDAIKNLSLIHLYGGGFLNDMWGDFMLRVTEFLLVQAPKATYLVSGQQITPPFHVRVAQHIEKFKPVLFGVRDELSMQLLTELGVRSQFSFDDATETLLLLGKQLPVNQGDGLLMHLNVSGYTANGNNIVELSQDLISLKKASKVSDQVTVLQAFRDTRQEVLDTRESIKCLDTQFPFNDVRTIDLVSFSYKKNTSPLIKPIVGKFAYSCSYHVALWLQLSGIPCWLRSRNSFYDQKSKALQVSQTLSEFLEAPTLANHSLNLSRREEWLTTFSKAIEQVEDVQYVSEIPQPTNGPAPWHFYFKGKPTLEEKLNLANEERHQCYQRIGHLEKEFSTATSDNAVLEDRILCLSSQITEIGNEAHSQRSLAKHFEDKVNTLLSEKIITRGSRFKKLLRGINRYIKHGHFDAQGQVGLFEIAQRLGRRVPISAKLRSKIGRLLVKLKN